MHPLAIAQILILLTLANGAPVIAKLMLGKRFGWPIDGNTRFFDGRPLFGPTKTVRGVLAALVVTTACALLLGLDPMLGLLVAASAMAGDLLSSFGKRRLALAPSSRAIGLDQIPESLLPLIVCRPALDLSAMDVAVGCGVFLVGELVLSRLMFRLGLRDRPY